MPFKGGDNSCEPPVLEVCGMFDAKTKQPFTKFVGSTKLELRSLRFLLSDILFNILN